MRFRTLCTILCSSMLLVAACSEVNPNGPPVSFAAPLASGPSNDAIYRFNEQPVTLVITNAVRTGSATVTYNVEVATNSTFTSMAQSKTGIAEGTGSTTSVTLTSLEGDKVYFWRWRAVVDGVVGEPSTARSFFVRPQVVLGVPEAEQPAASSDVYSPKPTFVVRNGTRTGPVGAITYIFEVSAVESFATTVARATGIAEGVTRTNWTPTVDLPEGTLYWRARAVDATNDEMSPFTAARRFERRQGIDLSAVVYHVGPNISSFAETSEITDAYHRDGMLCIFHTKLGVWPATGFFDEPGPILEGNQQLFALINGVWHSGSADWYRPGQACKSVDDHIAADSFAGKEPIASWRPQPGEIFGVMATTPARLYPAMKTVDERSNVMLIRW